MVVCESTHELVLRAISELHRIEISLHTLMKELPGDIKTTKDYEEMENEKIGRLTFGIILFLISCQFMINQKRC